MTSYLRKRKLRLNEFMQLAQGHPINKQQFLQMVPDSRCFVLSFFFVCFGVFLVFGPSANN